MTAPLVIVDYGVGNLHSAQKAFEHLGQPALVSSDAEQIASAPAVVLPGQGAFGTCMENLARADLIEPVRAAALSGRPFLGICVGMQLLFEESEESPGVPGLGIFAGRVVRFPRDPDLKVPHMGWNQLHVRKPAPHLADLPAEPAVYFVHSYYVVPRDKTIIAAETDYPTPFTSVIWQDNVFATQFHPEKSQKVGLAMLRKFAEA